MANDWDFSDEGRLRQSLRMRSFADFEKAHGRVVICDFVCPTKNTRQNFSADIVIWMDTITEAGLTTQIRYLKNLKILNFILLKEMILIMKKLQRLF